MSQLDPKSMDLGDKLVAIYEEVIQPLESAIHEDPTCSSQAFSDESQRILNVMLAHYVAVLEAGFSRSDIRKVFDALDEVHKTGRIFRHIGTYDD